MKRLAVATLALLLAACANVSRIHGEEVVHDRLAVHVGSMWNRVSDPWAVPPYDTWTQEGIPLDHLRLWGGIRPGQPLVIKEVVYSRSDGSRNPRVPTFRQGLSREQLVSLFEEVYARSGPVTITKVEPTVFAGLNGVRFEFAVARRSDDLRLRGVGWAAVRPDPMWGEELFAATFVAPRLGFFDRLEPMAEAVVKTAHVRGTPAPS